mmetsp:Transcript_96417/g.294921  ORF Transcript_96417/g.294921 Transcript_96417/m.294921 type:complete len:207 (+) Transcript_96417:504-1124(+)
MGFVGELPDTAEFWHIRFRTKDNGEHARDNERGVRRGQGCREEVPPDGRPERRVHRQQGTRRSETRGRGRRARGARRGCRAREDRRAQLARVAEAQAKQHDRGCRRAHGPLPGERRVPQLGEDVLPHAGVLQLRDRHVPFPQRAQRLVGHRGPRVRRLARTRPVGRAAGPGHPRDVEGRVQRIFLWLDARPGHEGHHAPPVRGESL